MTDADRNGIRVALSQNTGAVRLHTKTKEGIALEQHEKNSTRPQAVLGIDVGGTKTAAGVVDATGHAFSYVREFSPQNASGDEFFDFTLKLAQAALAQSQVSPSGVGVGCGGPMLYPAGIVSPLHIPAWRDYPLRQKLTEALGLEVIVDNDAKAFALGEALFGAGRNAKNMLGMVVSTGVGGGIVSAGRLQHGASGNAGHFGHVIVVPNGLPCECGARGCLTSYTSGTGLAQRARLAVQSGATTSLSRLSLPEITAELIAREAANGDPLASELFEQAGAALGQAIASATNLLDLDRVVIGGSIIASGELLFRPLHQALKRYACFPFAARVEVLTAGIGPTSGVVGAAALAFEKTPG